MEVGKGQSALKCVKSVNYKASDVLGASTGMSLCG